MLEKSVGQVYKNLEGGKNERDENTTREGIYILNLVSNFVAEGVETLEQLRLLQAIGCDEIQGYVIAPAMPPEQMIALASGEPLPPFDQMGLLPA